MHYLIVEMPDYSEWVVPIHVIIDDMSAYHASIDKIPIGQALDDSYKLLENDPEEIIDWAANNMSWEDVKEEAFEYIKPPKGTDYEEGWCNGRKELKEL